MNHTIEIAIQSGTLDLDLSWFSWIGGRETNQDYIQIYEDETWLCIAVADGAGGHFAGERAARRSVENFLEAFSKSPSVLQSDLIEMVNFANHNLLKEHVTDPHANNMFSTLICLVVHKSMRLFNCVHAGDSRLYWFSRNNLRLMTRDHSLQVLHLEQGGAPYEAPARNRLYSALGQPTEQLTIGCFLDPEILSVGDCLFLFTDGAWDSVCLDSIAQTLHKQTNAKAICETISEQVRKESSGSDNATACVIQINSGIVD